MVECPDFRPLSSYNSRHMSLHVNQKVQLLRELMQVHQLDAYIVPSSDPHQSEYVAEHWKCRAWLTGFTGSAGTAVVTMNHAGLWTDSRYFIQAEQQLNDSCFELHRLNVPHTPEFTNWLVQNLSNGARVGLDGRLFSVKQIRRLQKKLNQKGIEVVPSLDLIGPIWKDRPPLPWRPVFEHDIEYAGQSRESKIEKVLAQLDANQHLLITTLDDIAWLFNLRGSDIPCNPVFYAFALVGKKEVLLFTGPGNIENQLAERLRQAGVRIMPYDVIADFLRDSPRSAELVVDPSTTNQALWDAMTGLSIAEKDNVVVPLKAIKNPVEIAHFREVMKRDAVALTRLFMWLEDTLQKRAVAEVEVAEKLIEIRSEYPTYKGESFDAIVGYNANGAIVHYKPESDTCAHIQAEGMLLLDCGGQYLDGTTDITRTVALGKASAQQKRDFTLVLKGYIALDQVKFPEGTTGIQLDILARMHLWKEALNYGHGTGHGVGFFLNVHEGPQGFTPTPNTPRANTVFKPGMITSNEPGLYRTGQYGIRIENLVLCKEAEESDFGKFLQFETLTLFPIDTSLIDTARLSEEERNWINQYHARVFNEVSPLLNEKEREWLRLKCQAI